MHTGLTLRHKVIKIKIGLKMTSKDFSCYDCMNVDCADVNDWEIDYFCGVDEDRPLLLIRGNVYPIGMCKDFKPIIFEDEKNDK